MTACCLIIRKTTRMAQAPAKAKEVEPMRNNTWRNNTWSR